MRRVRSGWRPERTKTGESTRKPTNTRKNPISNGCKSADRYRTIVLVPVTQSVETTMNPMPRTALGGPSRNLSAVRIGDKAELKRRRRRGSERAP